jgi:cellulose synthase/poly-beta-1,6-N-acetylglucosamine synthase-like glycosyltransferase
MPFRKREEHFQPKLSILLPAHKSSRTILLALASTLLFKPKNSEVLVFLDGNNTNSQFLERATKRKDVRVFKSEKVLGISGALNYLLDKSSSTIVARMDADDICLPGRFHKATKLISQGKSDFVFLNAILFGKDLAPFFFVPQPPIRLRPEQSEAMLVLANPFCHPTMVARKASIQGLGSYRSSVAEDYDLWLRAQAAGLRLTRLRAYGLLYRRHPDQHTKQAFFQEREKSDELLQNSKRDLRVIYASKNGISPQDETLDSIIVETLSKSSFFLGFQLRTLPKILALLKIRL